MRVVPVLVAYFTADWIQVAITSYLHHFPDERVLVVDNNPRPGEVGWLPLCERERHWLFSHPRVDLLANPLLPSPDDNYAPHGLGIDAAIAWCRDRGADVLLHFEPDCVIEGRQWRENLLRAISEGAWMAGSVRKVYGPIHPTPSAWQVDQVHASFAARERALDESHPMFHELYQLAVLKALCRHPDEWSWCERFWDTGEKPWFTAAVNGRTTLVDAPDFRHYWKGSTTNRLDECALTERYPELAAWFRKAAEPPVRRVEDCAFRTDVGGGGETQTARCDLLRQWLGPELASVACNVERDACEACCASWPPSRSELNPVVASLLVTLCDDVVATEGVDARVVEKVSSLRGRAVESLDVSWAEPIPTSPVRSANANTNTCAYFGAEIGFRPVSTPHGGGRITVYECRHPNHRETTPAECLICRDWSARAGVEFPALRAILPVPERRQGSKVCTWSVGVITAPRRAPTLDMCLDSLIRAGWERPRLFVDSATTIATRHRDLPLTLREPRIGAFPNYYLAMAELVMRDPEADAFMLTEDDVVFSDREDLRSYLEEVLWPADPVGAVSLYCSSEYTKADAGWHRFDGAWVWGALAFIFSPESARQFLSDPLIFAHRASKNEGLADTDALIGVWSHQSDLPVFFPTPSLVQHIGDTSSLWPASRAVGLRRADRFAGDLGQL
jgi:hypothetical protein